MKIRLFVLTVAAMSIALGTITPARAQGVFYELDLGRAAIAYWEDHKAEKFAFVVAGQGVIYNSDAGEPLIGDVGCAWVANTTKDSFACGELDAFSIDNDLGAASAVAKFDAITIDFESGDQTAGSISFSVEWKGTDALTPRTHGGYYADDYFIGAYAGAEVARFAIDGTKGTVSAEGLGRAPTELLDAAILAGPNLMFDLHR